MPRPSDKPARVGEHTVKRGSKPTLGGRAQEVEIGVDNEAHTDRFPAVKEAFEESQKRFKDTTDQG